MQNVLFRIIVIVFCSTNLQISLFPFGTSIYSAVPKINVYKEKKNYTEKEKISIILNVRNDNDEIIWMFSTISERDFKINIKDENGVSVPLSSKGKTLIEGENIRRELISLNPNEESDLKKIELSELFELKKEGKYYIHIKRDYYLSNNLTAKEAISKVSDFSIIKQ